MQSFKNLRTLKEHFELHNINYTDKNSHSFKQWESTLSLNEYKEKNIFLEALLKRDSYSLFSTVVKICNNFRKNLKDLKNVSNKKYFADILVNECAFKSPVINKYGFAFHLRKLLRFYKNDFLQKYIKK